MPDRPTADDNDKFWQFVEETSKRVESDWPEWKKEGWDVLDRKEFSSPEDSSLRCYVQEEEVEYL